MTPAGLPDISDLERLAYDATLAGIDPVTVLAEKVNVTAHGPGWITAGDVHLSLTSQGYWHATIADPPVQTGRAQIRGAW